MQLSSVGKAQCERGEVPLEQPIQAIRYQLKVGEPEAV